MTDNQLLEAIRAKQYLDEAAITRVQREALLTGKSVEALLYERRLVPDVALAELKSQLLKVPYQKLNPAALAPELFGLIPEETARTYGVAPIEKRDDLLVVGMLHPDDSKAQEALKFIARRNHANLGVYLIAYGDWQDVLRRYSPYKSSIDAAVQLLHLDTTASARKTLRLEDEVLRAGEEAPIIKIVADTVREAVESRASDIHFEPQENYLRVRFRIDGDLREAAALPVAIAQPIISRVKVMSNLKIDETRIPQDGRFRLRVLDRDIDFRVATFPTPLGEKVAIRVLDPTTGLKSLDQLGLSPTNMVRVTEGLEKPFGIILLTGPTGSGKTTTLYALLQKLNNEQVNIVSLEDPVEYFVPGVNQSQVHPEIGYDFAAGLRQILRQDPDIIMVGEIRDRETAGLAVQAALTGHIVLSTLHTNNAAGVIPRLLDMQIEPFLLPVSLNMMFSQRLMGVLCQSCKAAEPAPPALQEIIKKTLAGLSKELTAPYSEPYKIYHASGCSACKGRGVVGRVAIYEVLRMSPGLEEIINTGQSLTKIVHEAKAQGMITMREDGILKALEGTVAIEEVLRGTEDAV
jgi:type IV pilus assembly protein PilB